MFERRKNLVWIALLGFLIWSVPSLAAEFHIGAGQTYATIQAAVDTYKETIDISGSGNVRDGWTIKSAPGDKVIWEASVPEDDYALKFMYTDRPTVEGIIFVNSKYGVQLQGSKTTGTQLVTNALIKDCVFYNCGQGIYTWYGSATGTAENNTFYSNDEVGFRVNPSGQYGSLVSTWTFKDNLVVDNTIGVQCTTVYGQVDVSTSGFYNNTTDMDGDYVNDLGGNVFATDPVFASTNIADDDFLYLSPSSPDSIVTGDSDGSYMGAYPQIPEPATLGLLLLGVFPVIRRHKS